MNHLIRKTALLGTEKEPIPNVTSVPQQLADLYQHIPEQNRELTFLTILTTNQLYQHLGWLPPKHTPPTPVTKEEIRPICSTESIFHLQKLLTSHFRPLLAEWLTTLDQEKFRLPPIYIPQLLNLAINWENIRRLILPVLGENGRWLAAQNDKWHYATVCNKIEDNWEQIQERWLEADFTTRRTMLTQQREINQMIGINLLQLSWASTPSHQNAQLLTQLRPHLSIEDEPFLDGLLDDSSQQVRRLTIQLLSELPNARLPMRMGQIVSKLLIWHPEKGQWDIQLPEEYSAEMARNGVLKQGAPKQWGKKGWWLLQMIEMSPLSLFTDNQPELMRMLQEIQHHPLSALIRQGWAVASLRQKNQLWAESLIEHYFFTNNQITQIDLYHIRLFTQLPISKREEIGLRLLSNKATLSIWKEKQALLLLLEQFPYHWNEPFARAVLGMISSHLIDEDDSHLRLVFRQKFQDLADYFPVSLYSEISTHLQQQTRKHEWQTWKKPIDTFLERLSFRRTMLAALKEHRER